MMSRARGRAGLDAAVLAAVSWTALAGLTACCAARVTEPSRSASAPESPPTAATAEPPPTSLSTHSAGPPRPLEPAAAAPSPAAACVAANAPPPPCVAAQAKPHHARHRKPKQTPQGPAPPRTAARPPLDAVIDAQVAQIGAPLTSILGKNVQGPKGEDLGRVVDVLADPDGRVRAAIIDFGGFLGVGTRRIAVDWPLLRFDPQAADKSIHLSVTREKLQSAPVYSDSARPRVLVPPTDAAPTGPTPANAADTGKTQK